MVDEGVLIHWMIEYIIHKAQILVKLKYEATLVINHYQKYSMLMRLVSPLILNVMKCTVYIVSCIVGWLPPWQAELLFVFIKYFDK